MKVNGHEIDSRRICKESTHSFAITIKNPILPGHVVCFPKRQVNRFSALSAEEAVDLYDLAHDVSVILKKHLEMTDLTLFSVESVDAGQPLGHVYVSVIPRKENDYHMNKDKLFDHIESQPTVPEALEGATITEEVDEEMLNISSVFKDIKLSA